MKTYRIDIYVPPTHADAVRDAILEAGAGRLGNYDSCCWLVPGKGRFRPRCGASPFIGETDKISSVDEIKIEAVFTEDVRTDVIDAVRKSHPYETPAFQYWEVFTE